MSASPTTVGQAWRAILARAGVRAGGYGSLVLTVLVILAFGVLVPWRRGFDFFDSFLIFAYSAIALLFAASALTDLVASSEAAIPLPPAIIAAAIHGWSVLALIYALGIATVNATFRAPQLFYPSPKLMGATLLFALTASVFVAALAAVLCVLFNPSVARTAMRLLFLLILLGLYFSAKILPPLWQNALDRQLTTPGLTQVGLIGAAISFVLAMGLVLALVRSRPPIPQA